MWEKSNTEYIYAECSTSPPGQLSPPDLNSPPSTSLLLVPTANNNFILQAYLLLEPTELRSSSTHASHSFLLIFTGVGILVSLLRQNNLWIQDLTLIIGSLSIIHIGKYIYLLGIITKSKSLCYIHSCSNLKDNLVSTVLEYKNT